MYKMGMERVVGFMFKAIMTKNENDNCRISFRNTYRQRKRNINF
jgi:hypothetical protein